MKIENDDNEVIELLPFGYIDDIQTYLQTTDTHPLLPFGFVDVRETFLETRNENDSFHNSSFKRASSWEEIENEQKLMELSNKADEVCMLRHPYNFKRSFSENLKDGLDKHIIIKISPDEDIIEVIPDWTTFFISKPSSLMVEIENLRYFIVDYDTIFGTRYNKFKNYDNKFFSCEERVLFESLIINFKRNDHKEFKWEKKKIGYELGIKRKKLESIISRFKELGIIKYAFSRSKINKDTHRNRNSFYFNLDCEKIIELLPKIFSKFDYEKVKHDIIKYLNPKGTNKTGMRKST